MSFFANNGKKVSKIFCQFAELSYLCTRFAKKTAKVLASKGV